MSRLHRETSPPPPNSPALEPHLQAGHELTVDVMDELWVTIDTTWGAFNLEQVVGCLPRRAFEKALVVAADRELHDLFFQRLWPLLSADERRELIQNAHGGWNPKRSAGERAADLH